MNRQRVIELYLPERVRRQFGETQDVPRRTACFARSHRETSQWGSMIQPHIAYADFAQLQQRQWDWMSDVVDAGTTEEYEIWFAPRRLVPLTDPDIPVPRRQEDFPLTGEEGDDEDEEEDEDEDEDEGDDDDGDGDDGGEDDDEPDSADQETLQDIPLEPGIARTEEVEMCTATIASQQDYIATLEREQEQFKAEIARLTEARDTAIAQAQ